eukprot:TRINITY_DN33530_c0_g1_i1.p1 TRINITY_DN33530_c0_g1~~TRINITY_DN33530_c0_g1_i1.p1  ORF type:complete len:411 (+),score=92.09 TRINITY_DN33530_c0_g1_i1:154-1233(+)
MAMSDWSEKVEETNVEAGANNIAWRDGAENDEDEVAVFEKAEETEEEKQSSGMKWGDDEEEVGNDEISFEKAFLEKTNEEEKQGEEKTVVLGVECDDNNEEMDYSISAYEGELTSGGNQVAGESNSEVVGYAGRNLAEEEDKSNQGSLDAQERWVHASILLDVPQSEDGRQLAKNGEGEYETEDRGADEKSTYSEDRREWNEELEQRESTYTELGMDFYSAMERENVRSSEDLYDFYDARETEEEWASDDLYDKLFDKLTLQDYVNDDGNDSPNDDMSESNEGKGTKYIGIDKREEDSGVSTSSKGVVISDAEEDDLDEAEIVDDFDSVDDGATKVGYSDFAKQLRSMATEAASLLKFQ